MTEKTESGLLEKDTSGPFTGWGGAGRETSWGKGADGQRNVVPGQGKAGNISTHRKGKVC